MPRNAEEKHRRELAKLSASPKTDCKTFVLTDLFGSAAIKQSLGESKGVAIIRQHHAIVRAQIRKFKGREINNSGDSFLITFGTPSRAVTFSLSLNAHFRSLSKVPTKIRIRIGIHIGEYLVRDQRGMPNPKDIYGLQVDLCSRVVSLANPDQILMTRAVFDSAKPMLTGQLLPGLKKLTWKSHGTYKFEGIANPFDIFEVGELGLASFRAPPDRQKAIRLNRRTRPEARKWDVHEKSSKGY